MVLSDFTLLALTFVSGLFMVYAVGMAVYIVIKRGGDDGG